MASGLLDVLLVDSSLVALPWLPRAVGVLTVAATVGMLLVPDVLAGSLSPATVPRAAPL